MIGANQTTDIASVISAGMIGRQPDIEPEKKELRNGVW